jgi:hypothetical protein
MPSIFAALLGFATGLAAGGIAIMYSGRIADLLGLNWAEMAHASGRRKGLRGHSAFDERVFWDHRPMIMLPKLVDSSDPLNECDTPSPWHLQILKGLLDETRFRQEYSPVLVKLPDGQLFAYARNDFVDLHAGDARVSPLTWQNFRQPASN